MINLQQAKLLPFLCKGSFTILIFLVLVSCSSRNDEAKKEEIRIGENSLPDSLLVNSIQDNLSFSQISSAPHKVVLTGLPPHRLVTVYKSVAKTKDRNDNYNRSSYYYEPESSEHEDRFMPGIDLIHGYNLLNIAHYDFTSEKPNFLFDHPVLVKSLYYPSFIQDSLYKKPINRNYYLVSVYDADTNGDTLINNSDLRRFYSFNSTGSEKIQLVPPAYSVVRSQYDPMNDVMYVYARLDANKDGKADKKEPLHIFWFSLKKPEEGKRLY